MVVKEGMKGAVLASSSIGMECSFSLPPNGGRQKNYKHTNGFLEEFAADSQQIRSFWVHNMQLAANHPFDANR